MPESNPSRSERAFTAAMRRLHIEAGSPSSRTMATAIGGISHTSVNSAVTGAKVPSWPITAKLVEHLGGNVEDFRTLWVEAREKPAVELQEERPEVSVFVSYARIDDEATYGRITKLIAGVASTYRSMTGQVAGVFYDVNSINPGDDWKDRIRLGLSSSSIFLAFVSPAFLRSAHCREEVSEFLGFLNANSSVRLVIPLLFAKHDRLERTFADDPLWQKISELQWLDISELRSAEEGSGTWIQRIEDIAERIDDILQSFNVDPVSGPSIESIDRSDGEIESDDEPGLWEKWAALEDATPEMERDFDLFASLMKRLGEETTTATPAMTKATTFGQKLATSKRLAVSLEPIANEMNETTMRLISRFSEWDSLVNHVLNLAKTDPDFYEDAGNVAFLTSMAEMSDTGIEALGHVEALSESIKVALGYSKDLDRPLKLVQGACLKMAGLRGLLSGWKDEVDALESANPGIS